MFLIVAHPSGAVQCTGLASSLLFVTCSAPVHQISRPMVVALLLIMPEMWGTMTLFSSSLPTSLSLKVSYRFVSYVDLATKMS